MFDRLCSDASFGYPGGPILFRNLNFGIDLDSRIASKNAYPSPKNDFSLFTFWFKFY